MTTGTQASVISNHWLTAAPGLRAQFLSAQPFPLLVLDDFLDPAFAAALEEEFPAIEAMPKSRDYLFGNKHELSSLEKTGPASASYHSAMTSEVFRRFLHQATGFAVFVDPAFHGGGFHQGADGSFLDMHVDFNVHPSHATWLRTLNILLYLNREWDVPYGGELLLTATPDGTPLEIAPRFNRAVVMLTDDHTFHGYRRMTLPPGVTRKSVAAYAYREVGTSEVRPRTTGWVPRNAGLSKRLLARNYNTVVTLKNRLLGSGTAKNR